MGLPRPICTRLTPALEERLEAAFDRAGWGPSEGLRHVVEEWFAAAAFDQVEFRGTALGRRAALRGGPEVWQVVQVFQRASDTAEVGRHFAWLSPAAIEQALAYYERFPTAIDDILATNARVVARMTDNSGG